MNTRLVGPDDLVLEVQNRLFEDSIKTTRQSFFSSFTFSFSLFCSFQLGRNRRHRSTSRSVYRRSYSLPGSRLDGLHPKSVYGKYRTDGTTTSPRTKKDGLLFGRAGDRLNHSSSTPVGPGTPTASPVGTGPLYRYTPSRVSSLPLVDDVHRGSVTDCGVGPPNSWNR